MRIIIDDGMSIDLGTGIGKYTHYLYKTLKDNSVDVELIKHNRSVKNGIFDRIKYILYINSKKYGNLIRNADLVHFTNYVIPLKKRKGIKYATTIHDLVMFKYPYTLPRIFCIYSRLTTYISLIRSDVVFTDSYAVKNEISEMFPQCASKTYVAYPGLYTEYSSHRVLDEIFDSDLLRKEIKGFHFLLYIGTIERRKNLIPIIEAFDRIKNDNKYSKYKLVLVGRLGYGSGAVKQAIEKSKNYNDIIMPGYLSSNDCRRLYSNADLFVFPSLYEGFGSTQLECMINSVPIALNDIPTNKEVSSSYGFFFDASNINSIVKSIKEALETNVKLDRRLFEDNNIIAKFKWDNLIEDYIQIYTEAIQ